MTFDSSTSDQLTTTDGLERPILEQIRQAPGSSRFDSTQTSYGWTTTTSMVAGGAFVKVSVPYQGPAGQSAPQGTAFTTTQYDVVGRPLTVIDGGAGTTSYQYLGKDVLMTVSAPATENPKKHQYEYDGVGRLTSVCEITSASGAGTCGQANSQKGYWTRYKYDTLGHLIGVCQNTTQPLTVDCVVNPSSGQQTRTFTYDMLGRLTSELNPESGKTNYFWDAAPPVCWNNTGWSTPGDLGAKQDNAGNYICYGYDGLHRTTGALTKPSGPCFGFVYDSATPPTGSGIVVRNTLGRMVEAYTNTNCAGTTNVTTDEWFGYSARGEVADTYELTPHSGGYFHTQKTYWPNGAVASLSGIPGVPTIYYGATDGSGLDGEGRVTKVIASSGQSPVSCTTAPCTSYNAAGQVTNMTLGSGDSDSYQFDSNTGRMTQYSFNVNGQSVIGTPTWNPNGTLAKLQITQDPFNSSNVQTCGYGYDDFARLASANCGSAWAQIFTYDVFGNITKTGSGSWIPGYNQATNQYLSAANCLQNGGTPCYDSNGKLIRDGFHTYQWDAYGHMISNDSSTFTYDAFGRMVEASWGDQYLYDTDGRLLAGSQAGVPAYFAHIPLPGGALANYSHGSLTEYKHPDWLGSVRFSSTPSRTVNYDMAFAPFGEPYASSHIGNIFAGMEQVIAADEYETPNREYHTGQGRWISPDPAGIAAAIPANPQSWNRYAYVLNNPLSFTDPMGLWCYYGTTDDNGMPDTIVGDSGDPSNYDFFSSQAECEGSPNAPTGGTWYPDPVFGTTVFGSPTLVDTVIANLPPLDLSSVNNCHAANFPQRQAIKVLTKAAKWLGKPVGFGAGGSLGAGIPFPWKKFKGPLGVYETASAQLVVGPDGSAYLSYSWAGTGVSSLNGQTEWLLPVVGVGGVGGFQGSVANGAPSNGNSVDISAGAADPWGGGIDVNVGTNENGGLSWQATGTAGGGFGGFGAGGAVVNNTVVPLCHP